MTQTTNQQEQNCTEKVQSILSNRKIVEVRYLTDQEQNILGWYGKPILLKLDDGSFINCSQVPSSAWSIASKTK
jgi:hypothetical protein